MTLHREYMTWIHLFMIKNNMDFVEYLWITCLILCSSWREHSALEMGKLLLDMPSVIFIDREAREIMHLVASVCPFVCVGLRNRPCAPFQWYMGAFCTIGHNMHHQNAMYTMVHKGDYIFFKNSGCPDNFWVPRQPTIVHHQAAMCTTEAQCTPWRTRETPAYPQRCGPYMGGNLPKVRSRHCPRGILPRPYKV